MFKKIKSHLDGVDETYFEHMLHAFIYGGKMIIGGFGAILHAICPAIFQYTASKTVSALHEQLQARIAFAKARENSRNAP